jgi:GAF domain-containing protein
MSISVFKTAPPVPNERMREEAVRRSGALRISNDRELQEIVEEARGSFGTRMSAVSILSEDWQYLIATAGIPSGAYSRRTSFCGHTVAGSSPLLYVADAQCDPRFAGNPAVEDGTLRFYAGAQVRACGFSVGALCVFDPSPRQNVLGEELDQLSALGTRVSGRLRWLMSRSA